MYRGQLCGQVRYGQWPGADQINNGQLSRDERHSCGSSRRPILIQHISEIWTGALKGHDPDIRHVIGRDGHLDQSSA